MTKENDMGQANERGTKEERASNSKGESWRPVYWTDQRLSDFKEDMSKECKLYIDKVRNDLFAPRERKKKRWREVRTGG